MNKFTDEELKARANRDWIDHTDSPYERYLELKIDQLRNENEELKKALISCVMDLEHARFLAGSD